MSRKREEKKRKEADKLKAKEVEQEKWILPTSQKDGRSSGRHGKLVCTPLDCSPTTIIQRLSTATELKVHRSQNNSTSVSGRKSFGSFNQGLETMHRDTKEARYIENNALDASEMADFYAKQNRQKSL